MRSSLAMFSGAVLMATLTVIARAESPEPAATLMIAPRSVDLTGTWLFKVTTDAGTGSPTVTLKQVGDSLTGHYSSQVLGEADLAGTVKGDSLTFTLTASVEDNSVLVTYTGAVVSTDSLRGTVVLGGLGSGTFTARRQG